MTSLSKTRGHRYGIRVLLGAVLISSLGEAMMIIAVPWFVLQTTGSPARTGVLLAVGAVTSGVAGVLAGPLVDRWGFRRTAVTAYLVGGAAAACIPLLHQLGRLDFPLLVALMAAASVLDVPGVAAVTGLVPELAGAAGMPLERANALLGGVHEIAQLCGVPLGGAAALVLGTGGVLALDAAGCLLAALVIGFALPKPERTPAERTPAEQAPAEPAPAEQVPGEQAPAGQVPPEPARGGPRRYLAELAVGLRALWAHRLLRAVAGSGAAFNALDSGLAGVVLVTFAYQELGSPADLGVLLTAFGLGVLAGTAGYAAVGHRFARRTVLLGSGLTVGLLIALLAALPGLVASSVLLAVLGAAAAPVGPVRTGVLQRGVPTELYGRVTSAVDTVGMAAVPLGASAAVVALESVGLRWTVLGIAAGYLLVVALCWRSSALREI